MHYGTVTVTGTVRYGTVRYGSVRCRGSISSRLKYVLLLYLYCTSGTGQVPSGFPKGRWRREPRCCRHFSLLLSSPDLTASSAFPLSPMDIAVQTSKPKGRADGCMEYSVLGPKSCTRSGRVLDRSKESSDARRHHPRRAPSAANLLGLMMMWCGAMR
jgi:hypothetical protein